MIEFNRKYKKKSGDSKSENLHIYESGCFFVFIKVTFIKFPGYRSPDNFTGDLVGKP